MAKKKDDFHWVERFVNKLLSNEPYTLMCAVADDAHDETSPAPKVVVPLAAPPIADCNFVANAQNPVCLTSETEIEDMFEHTKDRILDDDNPKKFAQDNKHPVEQLRKHRFDPTPFPALSIMHAAPLTLYIPLDFDNANTPYEPDACLPGVIDFSECGALIVDLHRYSIKAPDLNHGGESFKAMVTIVQPVRVGADRAGLLVTALGDANLVKAHRALIVFDDRGRLDTEAMAQHTVSWRSAGVRINTEDESREFVQRLMMILIHRTEELQAEDEENQADTAQERYTEGDRELAMRIHPDLIEPYDDDTDITSVLAIAHTLLHAYDDTLSTLESTRSDLRSCETKCADLNHTIEQQAIDHKREMDLALDRIRQLETAETDSDNANNSSAVITSLQSTIDSLKEQLDAAHGIQHVVANMTLPKNTFDSLSLAAQFWPDRLIVLDRAYASAKSFDGPAEEPFTHLQALACILWPIVFEENSNHPAQDFSERTTVNMTMKVNKRQLDKAFFDEYHLTYKGQTRDSHAHTKGANFRRGQSLRIHFFFDQEERKIVIAHCGDHLTNTMTARLS